MTRSRTGGGRFNPWGTQVPQAARTSRARTTRKRLVRTIEVLWKDQRQRGPPMRLMLHPEPAWAPFGRHLQEKGPAFQPAQESRTGRPELEDEPHLEAESARVLEAVGKTFPAVEDLVL